MTSLTDEAVLVLTGFQMLPAQDRFAGVQVV